MPRQGTASTPRPLPSNRSHARPARAGGRAGRLLVLLVLALTLVLSACGRNMYDQPRVTAFQSSEFFLDGAGMRPPVPNTVSREFGGLEPAFLTGQGPGGMLTELPIELTVEVLHRGQERYDIYCSPCHNYNGDGVGATVRRGFPQPASFVTTERLLDAPVGYYFSAMTNGFGRMFSYASRITAADRWAIAAYVKALQLSQNADPADIPENAVLDDEVLTDDQEARR